MKLAFKISIIHFCILAGTVNNGGGGGAGGSAVQVQVVNEPKKMEAKELLS